MSDVIHLGISQELRIDVEKQWYIHFLPRFQSLLIKTETLCLIEVGPDL